MASTSIQLLDLHPDILLKIFRDFIPLKDKLNTLLKIPEFRPLLEYRGSYLTSSGPFSFDYIQFLSRIRSGWYFYRENWIFRFYLRIDETTLHISLFHFCLGICRSHQKPNSQCGYKCESIKHMENFLDEYLNDYHYIEDGNLLTYYLKNYGFIMVYRTHNDHQQKMRFYDGTECMIDINQPCILLNYSEFFLSPGHFEVLWTPEKKLVVYCIHARNRCYCEKRIQVLSPITFEVTKDYKFLTWDDKDIPFPITMLDDFCLRDEHHVEVVGIYHITCPGIDRSQVETDRKKVEWIAKHNEHLKSILWVEDYT